MTYGEWRVYRREHLSTQGGECWFPEITHLKRMKNRQALDYYNAKLEACWIELGYRPKLQDRHIPWKYWWELSSNSIEHLPENIKRLLKDLFVEGYMLGVEYGSKNHERIEEWTKKPS